MKKMTKKLGAIVLALAMCFSLCCTAFAASGTDEDFSITITNAAAGQTYTAYKIFDVTYDDNGNYSYTIQSSSAWYAFFTDAANAEIDGNNMPFAFTQSAGDTSTYVVTVKENFDGADIINYLTAAIAQIGEPAEQADGTVVWTVPEAYGPSYTGTTNSDGTVTIEVRDPGYYFVTTTNGSVVSITTTSPAATITDKNEGFNLNKEVKTNGMNDEDAESADAHGDAEAMGDDVEFEVTANVPLYTAVEPDNVKDDPEVLGSPEGYLVTDYSFEDQMTAGLEIRDLTEVTPDTASEAGYYTETDSNGVTHYYATGALINSWITLTDASGVEYKLCGDTSYDYDNNKYVTADGYAYNVVLELTNVSYYIDDEGIECIQFDGFTLYYDTLPYVIDEEGVRHLYYTDENGDEQEVTATSFQTAPELVEAVGTEYPANASIKIDYTAHVTSEADYDNTNDITMHWDGTTYRTPNPLEPEYKGSEKDEDDIYVLELDVLKVDGKDGESPLAGATFTLEGTNLKDVVTNSSESYVDVDDYNTYVQYKNDGIKLWFELKDGTYTDVDPYDLETANPNDPALDNYVVNPYYGDPEYPTVGDYKYVAYLKEEEHAHELVDGDGSRVVTGTTQADGTLTFTGLTVGDWTLTEIVAPDGYNLLDEPIKFTVNVEWYVDDTTGNYLPDWTIITEEGNQYIFNVDDSTGHISITIANNSGTELPGTGGIGTTIFYIIGGVLVVGAVVVLVTRRRVNHEA